MAAPGDAQRNVALDFAKGMLVLLMILYHWMTHFTNTDEYAYRYLRFITPSFIFITGFLIANIYLSKYQIGDPRLHKRLLQRGLKLLALFTLLNVVGAFAFARHSSEGASGLTVFFQNAGSTFGSGNGAVAAFSVLVPISYVLILSSVLLWPCKWHRFFLHEICLLLFLGIFLLHIKGYQSANLELFTAGLLGMVLGQISLDSIDRVCRHPVALLIAYGAYLLALHWWREIYPLQLVGVCLSLLTMYLVGKTSGNQRGLVSGIALLGRYSLFAYIAQMGIILVLAAGFRRLNLGHGAPVLSFVGAFALTIMLTIVVDYARARIRTIDRVYRTVFA